ncbi:LPS-assembly protein LptD [Limisalsivibrio acetivorans]|uniref:LPS-assembly protein LptD n=1 Tax=Limisalsivibrio acetivorans TaxID=1304888 RepID=UPI0003B73890|nr:LPS assembly protein LptD [Limisalsivibrio acetivorans]
MRPLLLFSLLFLFAISAYAESVTLTADTITSPDNKTFNAEGNVVILRDNATMKADRVRYNKETGLLEAFGSVRVLEGNNQFTCNRLKYDTNTEKGTFYDAEGFVEPFHRFQAEKLERTGDVTYILNKSRFSTCSGPVPDWSFTSSYARMDIGKYIKANHAAMRIKDVPIAYTPYFVYPIKKERESGLLIPKIGSSSKRGSYLGLKYFHDIDVNKDFTIGLTPYTSGLYQMIGEYRHVITENERVYLYGEYMDDWMSESDEQDRWMLFQDTNLKTSKNTELYLDVNYVSDFRYLRDLGDLEMLQSQTQYDNPDNKFYAEAKFIGRWKYADAAVRLKNDMQYRDYDDSYKRTDVYRSPNLYVKKNLRFTNFGINYRADFDRVRYSEYRYYMDTENSRSIQQKYTRLHASTEFYVPINMQIATLRPSITVYATHWSDFDKEVSVKETGDHFYAEIEEDGGVINRRLYKGAWQISLNEIYRKYDSFKHSIYNTFRYEEIPELNHSGIPDRIPYDEIEKRKLYTYTLKNYLKGDDWTFKGGFDQGYDLHEDQSRFTPLTTTAEMEYGEDIYIYARHKYDYYSNDTDYLNERVEFRHGLFFVSEEYTYDNKEDDDDYEEGDENTSLEYSLGVTLPKLDLRLSAKTSGYNRNLSIGDLDTKTYTVDAIYKSDCWNAGFTFISKDYNPLDKDGQRSSTEQIIYLTITLRGLGTFRSPVSTIRSTDEVDNLD